MVWKTSWSPAEDHLLITHRADGEHHSFIAKRLKRTEASTYSRLQYHGAVTVAGAKRVVAENRIGQRGQPSNAGTGYRPVDPEVCPSIVAAQDNHFAALEQRSLTAAILGDPPPGRSALDQRLAKIGAIR